MTLLYDHVNGSGSTGPRDYIAAHGPNMMAVAAEVASQHIDAGATGIALAALPPDQSDPGSAWELVEAVAPGR